jgi:hypothetical protein
MAEATGNPDGRPDADGETGARFGPDADVRRPLDESAPMSAPVSAAPEVAPEMAPEVALRSAVPPAEGTTDADPDGARAGRAGTGTGTGTEESATAAADTEPPEPETTDTEPPAPETTDTEPPEPETADSAAAGTVVRHHRSARRRAAQAARRTLAWSRRPAGQVVLAGVLIAVMLGLAAGAGGYFIPAAATPRGGAVPTADPVPAGPPGTAAPTAAPTGGPQALPPLLPTGLPTGPVDPDLPAGPGLGTRPADVLRGWAQQASAATGVPVVAVQAYGYAELVAAQATPACRLSWTTLAAIGRVESNHGGSNNATLLADGRALPPIVGAPLDGTGGNRRILDTDGGTLDGDPVYDRAVGPMQFIPTTWRTSAVDADGDGTADPNDIDDAAVAAAGYLCANNRDLATAEGWWAAVLSYNNVQSYAEQVFDTANEYGQRSG